MAILGNVNPFASYGRELGRGAYRDMLKEWPELVDEIESMLDQGISADQIYWYTVRQLGESRPAGAQRVKLVAEFLAAGGERGE